MKSISPTRHLFWRSIAWVALALLACVPVAAADLARLLILHTNDIHDHVRAGQGGAGGLPYVSGYIRSVRAERTDVLVLDAGDVTEKGDLVAFRTHSEMTYEALRRIGYDAVTIGNHEYDEAGLDGLRVYEKILGRPLVCLNLVEAGGAPVFEPSRMLEVNGVKVGVVGLIVPRDAGSLDYPGSGRALAAETARLRAAGVHLVVALAHNGVPECTEWSRMAPDVNVFVGGHSHEAMAQPQVVPETGAIIVQAGSNARWVGRLELEVDRSTGRVVRHEGRLVAMRDAEVPVDREMLAWVQETERRVAPDAAAFVFENPAVLDGYSVARLAAEGLRRAAQAEVAFCHPAQIIRDILPAGPVDVNALFKTGGQRGHATVLVELTGAEIEAYVNALQSIRREQPEWAGFRAAREPGPDGSLRYRTDLEPARRYRVIMAKLEWETRFLRMAEKIRLRDPASPLALCRARPAPAATTFTDALRQYVLSVLAEGATVQVRADELAARRSL